MGFEVAMQIVDLQDREFTFGHEMPFGIGGLSAGGASNYPGDDGHGDDASSRNDGRLITEKIVPCLKVPRACCWLSFMDADNRCQ